MHSPHRQSAPLFDLLERVSLLPGMLPFAGVAVRCASAMLVTVMLCGGLDLCAAPKEVRVVSAGSVGFVGSAGSTASTTAPDGDDASDSTSRIAQRLFELADKEHWQDETIGRIMASAGRTLVGTPYVGGTLESDGPEQCVVHLEGLDCVTFFENMLAFARCVKAGKHSLEHMKDEVEWTRYRNGKVLSYTSRLHYTGDWITNNVEKNVVTNITRQLGGIPFPLKVGFMSKNPKYYKALQRNPEWIAVIAAQEKTLSARQHWYIPKEKVASIESKLQSGDIIAITTSKEGLDYSHTGMIYKTPDGIAHFMHASSAKKKVVLDEAISEVLKTVPTNTGITVLRPREPNTKHGDRR